MHNPKITIAFLIILAIIIFFSRSPSLILIGLPLLFWNNLKCKIGLGEKELIFDLGKHGTYSIIISSIKKVEISKRYIYLYWDNGEMIDGQKISGYPHKRLLSFLKEKLDPSLFIELA